MDVFGFRQSFAELRDIEARRARHIQDHRFLARAKINGGGDFGHYIMRDHHRAVMVGMDHIIM